jgi:hypothetical protein
MARRLSQRKQIDSTLQQQVEQHVARRETEDPQLALVQQIQDQLGNKVLDQARSDQATEPQTVYLAHLLELTRSTGLDVSGYLPWNAPLSWNEFTLPYCRVLAAEAQRDQADAAIATPAPSIPAPSLAARARDARGAHQGDEQLERDIQHAGSGRRLRAQERAFLTAVHGADPGDVRIHEGPRAREMSRTIHARAFATGRDIFLGEEARVDDPRGAELLAHEATHVLQAQANRIPASSGPGLSVSSPSDPHEQEAEARGRRARRMVEQRSSDDPWGLSQAPDLDGTSRAIIASIQRALPPAETRAPPALVLEALHHLLLERSGLELDSQHHAVRADGAPLRLGALLADTGAPSVDDLFHAQQSFAPYPTLAADLGEALAALGTPAVPSLSSPGAASAGAPLLSRTPEDDEEEEQAPPSPEREASPDADQSSEEENGLPTDAGGPQCVDEDAGGGDEQEGGQAQPAPEGQSQEQGSEGEGQTEGEQAPEQEEEGQQAAAGGEAGGEQVQDGDGGGEDQAGTSPAGPVSIAGGASPQLGGFTPTPDLELPDMEPSVAQTILEQTGAHPREHLDRAIGALDLMRGRAESLQAEAVEHARGLAEMVASNWSARAEQLPTDAEVQRGNIIGVYADARARVTGASGQALAQVEADAGSATSQLDQSYTTQSSQVQLEYQQSQERVQALHEQWVQPFVSLLDERAPLYQAAAEAKARTLREAKVRIAQETFPDADVRGAMARAEQEVRRESAKASIEDAATDIHSRGPQKAEEVRGLRSEYDGIIGDFLEPQQQQVEAIGTHAAGAIDSAYTDSTQRITEDRADAEGTIQANESAALEQLNADEQADLDELDSVVQQMQADLLTRSDGIVAMLDGAAAEYALTYPQFMDSLYQGIPTDTFLTADEVEAFVEQQQAALEAFHHANIGALDEDFWMAELELEDMLIADAERMAGIAERSATEAGAVTDQKVEAINQTAVAFGESMLEVGGAVDATMLAYIAPLQEDLTAYVEQCQEDLAGRLDRLRDELETGLQAYGTELDGLATSMGSTIRQRADAEAAGLRPQLEQAAHNAYDAMRGAGTDENKLMNALRPMTALKGAALEIAIWPDLFSNSTGLRAWLDSDLSGDEYRAAINYLNGNTAVGARYELESNMRWYGDDEEQIEAILRDLSPEAREAMMALPEWEETASELRDNLGGTDLNVTEALLVGNARRADAYRLRDSIDAARRKGDDDALADALQGIDPAHLAAIQQEFVHIEEGGEANADLDPIDQAEATERFADWVVRDVEVTRSGGHGHTYTQTMRVDGADRDLVMALATQGRDSDAAAVARFEVEANRRGGPEMERLETALYANDDLQQRLHSPDEATRQAAQQEQAAREQRIRALYEQTYERDMDDAIDAMFPDGDEHSGVSERLVGNMLADGTNTARVAADQIHLATDRWGTDEEQIKRALTGMRPDEVASLRQIYADQHGDGDLEALDRDLGVNNRSTGNDYSGWGSELSGDGRREVEELLLGDPRYMNDEQRFALAQLQYEWTRGDESTWLGRTIMGGGEEAENLEQHWAELSTMRATMFDEHGNFTGTEQEYERYATLCRYVGITAETYRAATDRIANYITTGFAIAVAVVATILSGGTLGPAAAMLVAGVTGLGSMGINYTMKGGRYGWEQATVDLANTAVSVATAGVGARLNNPLNKGGIGGIFGPNASRAQQIAGQGIVQGGLGFVEGATQTALNDRTWDDGLGDGMGRTLLGGGRQAVVRGTQASVGEYMNGTAWGQAWSQGNTWQRMAFNGVQGGLADGSGAIMGLGVDALSGREIDPEAAFEDVVTQAITGSVTAALQSLGEGWMQRIESRRRGDDLSVAPDQGTQANPLQEQVVHDLAPSAAETRTAVEAQLTADGIDLDQLTPSPAIDPTAGISADPTGPVVVDSPDGAMVQSADGTRSVVGDDGAAFGQASDGTQVGETSNGAPAAVETPDGTRALIDGDGTQVVQTAEGEASIRRPDGSIESTEVATAVSGETDTATPRGELPDDQNITQSDIDDLASVMRSGGPGDDVDGGATFTFRDANGDEASVPASDFDFVERVRANQRPGESFEQASLRTRLEEGITIGSQADSWEDTATLQGPDGQERTVPMDQAPHVMDVHDAMRPGESFEQAELRLQQSAELEVRYGQRFDDPEAMLALESDAYRSPDGDSPIEQLMALPPDRQADLMSQLAAATNPDQMAIAIQMAHRRHQQELDLGTQLRDAGVDPDAVQRLMSDPDLALLPMDQPDVVTMMAGLSPSRRREVLDQIGPMTEPQHMAMLIQGAHQAHLSDREQALGSLEGRGADEVQALSRLLDAGMEPEFVTMLRGETAATAESGQLSSLDYLLNLGPARQREILALVGDMQSPEAVAMAARMAYEQDMAERSLVIGADEDLARTGALDPDAERSLAWSERQRQPAADTLADWRHPWRWALQQSIESRSFHQSGRDHAVAVRLLHDSMMQGQPIRDASIDSDTGALSPVERGSYAGTERDYLRRNGWSFDADSQSWHPPTDWDSRSQGLTPPTPGDQYFGGDYNVHGYVNGLDDSWIDEQREGGGG